METKTVPTDQSRTQINDHRLVGEILHDYLENSNEPLAVAYRDQLFKSLFPNTELEVDLKLITREPGRMEIGAFLEGAIIHDGEDHFTFVQNVPEKKKVNVVQRNPHVYVGKCINVNRKSDGTLYPTFNRPRYTKTFTFQTFCREAAEELLFVARPVEKGDK